MGDKFPWDHLKGETLRLNCRDLGFKGLRRDAMIQFLTTVEQDGLEEALKIDHITSPQKRGAEASVSTATSSPSKRRLPVVSDYNTRHKAKRIRVLSDPGPGLRRRGRPPKPKPAVSEAPKKRRGRPPKTLLEPKPHSHSSQKEVFDGVELPVRSFFKAKRKAPEEIEVQVPEQGEYAHSDGLPEQNGDASSLASSNKENQIETQETTAPHMDEDADAEGEDEVALASHQTRIQVVDVNNLTPEVVVGLEEIMRSVVENGLH